MADGIPSLQGLPWGSPPGWTSPELQQRPKLETQTTSDGYFWYRGAEDLLLTELRMIPINTGEVWKTHRAKIESWVKRPQQTSILSASSGKIKKKAKDLMFCGQLAPGRFSEGKTAPEEETKRCPTEPREEAERCWPGARPQGRHLMAMLCPQGLVRSSPKQQQGSAGFVPWVWRGSGSSSHYQPVHNLHLTPLFSKPLGSGAAGCSTAITQNIYQCTTVYSAEWG